MIDNLDLHGGSFKAVFPYRGWGWFGYVLMALISIAGAFMAISGFSSSEDDVTIGGMFLLAVGLTGLAVLTPGSHEKDLYEIRQQAIDPAILEAKAKESGLTVDSWFLRQTTYVPTNDPNDWILPAPGPASWNKENRYQGDPGEEPLPEHPAKVGTPVPATFSMFGLYGSLAALLTIVGVAMVLSSESSDASGNGTIMVIILIVISLVLAGFGWFKSRMLNQMIDMPTSLVRSVPVGFNELVGQVRPAQEGVLRVVVDGNQEMSMENMVAYKWEYEQQQKRTVTDSEGNSRTETRWVTIRTDSGGCPFILHDGTGGIRVHAQSFKRTNYGNFIKRWDSAFAKSLGKQFMSQMVAGMVGGWRVVDHRWTLYGMKLGNPVYLIGEVKSRPRDEIEAEGLDGTLQNSIVDVWGGEDAPGTKVTLNRGSELTNIGKSRSSVEMLVIPLILLLGSISLLVLA